MGLLLDLQESQALIDMMGRFTLYASPDEYRKVHVSIKENDVITHEDRIGIELTREEARSIYSNDYAFDSDIFPEDMRFCLVKLLVKSNFKKAGWYSFLYVEYPEGHHMRDLDN